MRAAARYARARGHGPSASARAATFPMVMVARPWRQAAGGARWCRLQRGTATAAGCPKGVVGARARTCGGRR
eukprot:7391303-Prymnesium_polylepis.1